MAAGAGEGAVTEGTVSGSSSGSGSGSSSFYTDVLGPLWEARLHLQRHASALQSNATASSSTHLYYGSADTAAAVEVLTRFVQTLQWLLSGVRQLLARVPGLQGVYAGDGAERAAGLVLSVEQRANELDTWASVVKKVLHDLQGVRLAGSTAC